MKSPTSLTPDYGNWVSKKFTLVPGILCLFFVGLTFLALYLVGASGKWNSSRPAMRHLSQPC